MTRSSSYLSEKDALRTMLRRAAIVAVNDRGSQQLVDLFGYAGDKPAKVPTVGTFGLSANAPPGGIGMIVCPGGRSDKAMFFGGEHPNYRPTNLQSGATQLYDAFNHKILLTESGIVIVGNITLTGSLVASGDVKAGSISLENHVHGGVQAGGSNTGPPTG